MKLTCSKNMLLLVMAASSFVFGVDAEVSDFPSSYCYFFYVAVCPRDAMPVNRPVPFSVYGISKVDTIDSSCTIVCCTDTLFK